MPAGSKNARSREPRRNETAAGLFLNPGPRMAPDSPTDVAAQPFALYAFTKYLVFFSGIIAMHLGLVLNH